MSRDDTTSKRHVWSAIAIVATVFVIPVIILVFAIQGLDDAYRVSVHNESARALREVRVVANRRTFELGTLDAKVVQQLSEEFRDALVIQVGAMLGDTRIESEEFSRPLTGAREDVELVFGADGRWVLRRR